MKLRQALRSLFFITAAHTGFSPASGEKPNILLIAIDTLRADRLSCYGHTNKTTPVIDSLAKNGVVFTNCIASASWTMPSFGSIFTSVHPSGHGAISYRHKLAPDLTTLAELLKSVGYHTAGFISNPTLDRKFGFQKGFDHYDDKSIAMRHGMNLYHEADFDKLSINATVTSHTVTDLAAHWLEKSREEPFFCFALYFDPHDLYVPPIPYNTQFDKGYQGKMDGRNFRRFLNQRPKESLHFANSQRTGGTSIGARLPENVSARDLKRLNALYDGEICYTDHCIGRLLDKLRELKLFDNTLIIVTADHGEEFMDHGGVLHGHTLYDEQIRVPLIVHHPASIPGGRRIQQIVSHIDYLPTLCELVGSPVPEQAMGKSFWPLLKPDHRGAAQQDKTDRYAISESSVGKVDLKSITSGRYKLVYEPDAERVFLYDRRADPGEHKDLSKEKQGVASMLLSMLRAEITAARKRCAEPPESGLSKDNKAKTKMDENLLRKLKSLGYL